MTTYPLNTTGSTCASNVSYDDQAQTLTVTYRGSGKAYTYDGVSLQEYKSFLNAPSSGQWINHVLKPNHPFR